MTSLGQHLHATRIGPAGSPRDGRVRGLSVILDLPSGTDLGIEDKKPALYVVSSARSLGVSFARGRRRIERLCGRGRYSRLVLDLRLVESATPWGLQHLAGLKRFLEDAGMTVALRTSHSLALLLRTAGWPQENLVTQFGHRIRASSSMADSEEHLLRSIVDTLPDLIYIKDGQGRFIYANPAYIRLIGGQSQADLLGKTVYDFFPPMLAAIYHDSDIGVIQSGQPLLGHEQPIVSREKGANPGDLWMSVNKVPLRGAGAEIRGVISLGRDITARRQAELARAAQEEKLQEAYGQLELSHNELKSAQSALVQAEKMESLGRLAAGVAHEVKNPLAQVVLGMDYLVGALNPEGGAVSDVVSLIRGAASRIDRIITEMLDFSTPREMGMGPCSMADVIGQALLLLKGEFLRERIHVERDLDPNLPPTLGDAHRLEQTFINFFINAIHAMPGGGTLSIKTYTRNFTSSEREDGQKHTWFRAGDVANVVEICDTGHGIPEEKIGRIFEPFFTTKEGGKGTGLGLSVTRKIIELHHGRLTIKNRPEGGVMVSVMLQTAAPAHSPASDS